jgi:hypothetical protein
VFFGISGYEFDNTFGPEIKNGGLMKNLMYFLLCDILILALALLTSCSRQDAGQADGPAPVDKEYLATYHRATTSKSLFGSSAIRFSSSKEKDTSSIRSRMSEQTQQELIIWSTSGGF